MSSKPISEQHLSDMRYPGQYTLTAATYHGLTAEIQSLRERNAKLLALLREVRDCRTGWDTDGYYEVLISWRVSEQLDAALKGEE